MSLIEEYYELNEAEEVSAVWKILQIGMYGFAAVLGLVCGFLLGSLRLKFDDRCYLFTDVRPPAKDDKTEQNNINWESDVWCDYYQFSMVSSFMVGIIWGTLFLMCGKGGKSLTGLPQPWRIVSPSLIFNLIYFIIILITAISIQRGTNRFCGRPKTGVKSLMESCDPVKQLIKKDLYLVLLQIEIVVKTSWGCAVFWFLLFLLSFIRIVLIIDFQIYKICVFKIDDTVQNKKEEVLRITNYEEPKKLNLGSYTDRKNLYEEFTADDAKKTKEDKKLPRQRPNVSVRFPNRPNPVFYDSVDLRMLNKDKKRKKSSKILEAYGQNKLSLGLGNSQIPTFLCQYAPEYFNEGDEDEDEGGSFSATQNPDLTEDADESGSRNEVPTVSCHDSESLKIKKRI